MIQSMTGFGRIEETIGQIKYTLEIKSLNSKTMDLSIKMPYKLKEKELAIRKLITEKLVRGKVDFYLSMENSFELSDRKIDSDQIKTYITELKNLLPNQPEIEYLKMAILMPEIIQIKEKNEEEEQNWESIEVLVKKAIDSLCSYRKTEGEILENEISTRICTILLLLKKVEIYENDRINTVKERIENKLSQNLIEIDKNRFEQELIYYLEKLDVTEEKVRLESNCNYFLEEIALETPEVGKKLGFISQEIGREINTLGSKSNHFEMQKIVVNMKDELEKIKEQLLNVL
jgi:uncharacterized protein (TIGR00255 family)